MTDCVLWAALAIGGTTLMGTGCGFFLSAASPRLCGASTAFAAGVMLAAAAFGLYAPAMEAQGLAGAALVAAGSACGALLLRAMRALPARLGARGEALRQRPELLFVLAIALHKFPEGMAGGVGLGGMNPAAAATVVAGIALQNLPEGMVMIPPLLGAGVRRSRAALVALATGLLNAAGVAVGALWGHLAAGILPFALALAGGAMLDVIAGEMLPALGQSRSGRAIFLLGFSLMCCVNMIF